MDSYQIDLSVHKLSGACHNFHNDLPSLLCSDRWHEPLGMSTKLV